MKIINIFIIATIFLGLACSDMNGQVEMKTKQDSVAYAIGLQWGKSLKLDSLMLNAALIKSGIEDAFKDAPKLTDAQIQTIMTALQQEIQDKRIKKQQEAATANLDAGNKFLEANKKKDGVKTTASGLQYIVLKEGTGASPKSTDKVKVHYEGKLIDGKVFDSSIKRGEPITFPLNGVIPGWTEGLQLMKEGGKCRFFIPPALAYGAQGSGAIGPNEVLIFDVELIAVNPKDEK
jgi:FKBP-type peptidyl-prolyl cis-trans isomerase